MTIDTVRRVAVLGAGSMGHGIAEVAAIGGYEVTMRDIETDLVQDGYENIEWSVEKLAEKGNSFFDIISDTLCSDFFEFIF
ncbi:hypothetical protein EL22_28380 [Halostagnicola sp. A56]|nr:hypothetical protein EL22_28380 [Halostagnicola sp. A56]